ncbi:MAG: hypothetical protein LBM04_07370 [Opitutaceae bacterium]|nr:hypothetical protein [Opitutaceae bacterium]
MAACESLVAKLMSANMMRPALPSSVSSDVDASDPDGKTCVVPFVDDLVIVKMAPFSTLILVLPKVSPSARVTVELLVTGLGIVIAAPFAAGSIASMAAGNIHQRNILARRLL